MGGGGIGGRPPPTRVPFGSVQKLRLACAGIYDLRPPRLASLFLLERREGSKNTGARVIACAQGASRLSSGRGHAVGSSRDSRLAMGTSRLDQRSCIYLPLLPWPIIKSRAMGSSVLFIGGGTGGRGGEGVLEYYPLINNNNVSV